MLESLKEEVCKANLELATSGLVLWTFGNVSGLDRASGHMVIKPSGVAYSEMKPHHMVVVALDSGKVVEGELRPSSDTPTHLELYRAWSGLGGVVHTHSSSATAWAQARRDLLCLGTTHADYFHGAVPCTRPLSDAEVQGDYEANTGKVVVETFGRKDPMAIPAVLVADHGPFTWGPNAHDAVKNAIILEFLADLALKTASIDPYPKPLGTAQLDKHYGRKHGPGAYYGQK